MEELAVSIEIVLITGMSGSGKSVALHALEDAGYYCVDNLPPELLSSFVDLEHRHHGNKVAIAMDARSAVGLPHLPKQLEQLQQQGLVPHLIFLDASTETLVRRFSETRRRHPLAQDKLTGVNRALMQDIESERELLGDLKDKSHVIDTSYLRASQLQSYIKELIAAPVDKMTLVFQSFGFKHGLPSDSDYVFDVRMLPNPHYEADLRPLTGMDRPVADFLRAQPEVKKMQSDIEHFLNEWLPVLAQNHRSYVTVAIGCTGGQHRSVYLVEQLAEQFSQRWPSLRRHRALESHVHATAVPAPVVRAPLS